ncbi:MAG TPA: sulfite exporter TauE/SafE family protein, partial [Rhizomicrobium sp.]|nr:sulfite exporter TauE/SafE family protein [Rhizomicrobium sp.]
MPDIFQHIDPLYVISGVLVGGLVGFTGVGGGSLMTPILILIFGVHPASAVGTDLLYAAATKTGGSLVHGYNRTIDWTVVGRLALGSVPMTALSVLLLYWLGVDSKAS